MHTQPGSGSGRTSYAPPELLNSGLSRVVRDIVKDKAVARFSARSPWSWFRVWSHG